MAVNLLTLSDDIYSIIRTQLDTYKVAGSKIVASFPQKDPVFPAIILPVNQVNVTPEGVKAEMLELPVSIELEFWVQQKDKTKKVSQVVDAARAAFINLDDADIEFISFEQSNTEPVRVNKELFYVTGAVVNLQIVK